MFKISHRGNVQGPNKQLENKPGYVMQALRLGFDVEIDVWYERENFYLGHDQPDYIIEKSFLLQKKLWCHAKNINALQQMIVLGVKNCFWHQEDDCTLTSSGYIWTYPGKELTTHSICVMPDSLENLESIAGVCSDYIGELK